MKYCLSIRQPDFIRQKADEIYIEWKDRKILYDLSIKDPNKTYILEVPSGLEDNELNLREIQSYHLKNLIFALSDFKKINLIRSYKFPFYWRYPVTSYFELRALKDLGVCYILLGAPLYFDLKTVKDFEIPIRLVANFAYDDFLPRKNGIKGTYVRPEDVQYYEEYVDTLEFYSEFNKQEETLFKIYKNDKKWPGNLKLIIANLKSDVDNRGLPEEFGKIRIQCRQNCMRNGACNFCETAFIFSQKLDQAKDKWVQKNKK